MATVNDENGFSPRRKASAERLIKSDAVTYWDLSKTIETLEEQVAPISARLRELKQERDGVRDAIRERFIPAGFKTLIVDHCAIARREGLPSVVVKDLGAIPKKYKVVRVEPKRREILDFWRKNGTVVDGTEIEIGESTIAITLEK